MRLTDRDVAIVRAVARFGVLTRTQIARHLAFRSVTRVNAVLLRLASHGYLRRRVQPTLHGTRRLTYTLGRLGAELVDDPSVRSHSDWQGRSDLFLDHELHVNDVRLAFEEQGLPDYRLIDWLTPSGLRAQALGVIPDGCVQYTLNNLTFVAFIEADLGTESRARWRSKVESYRRLALSGRHEQVFGLRFFRVLVVTTTERRLVNIAGEIARQTEQIFWLTTFDELLAKGPLGSVWRRPKDHSFQSLTT